MNLFKIASIAAAIAVVAGLMMNWPDLRRYMKIEKM
jgi:hypothetical protein